jgi:hydrogenase small subunit
VNFNITRRQFLQYCAASAAALGLSQTDLLKLEKALATPATGCTAPSPSVIWLTSQACSGCPVSLLNRVVMLDGKYYDADMLNALYGTTLPTPASITDSKDPANFATKDGVPINPLDVVNDATDLLVGDAVRALVPPLQAPGARSLLWADDMSGVIPGSLLDAYAGGFPTGYATLEWNTTVMAAAGDIPVSHLRSIRNGGGILGVFLVIVDGAIPSLDKDYCWVFDNNIGGGQRAVRDSDAVTNGVQAFTGPRAITANQPVSSTQALEWLAGAPGCLGVVSMGACASYGGIPSGLGNKTGAMGVKEYFDSQGITTPVINVPGCPPHPDWLVYPVAYILAYSTPGNIALPTLDSKGRPAAVFSGSDDGEPFCYDCPNKPTQGTAQAAQVLGQAGCVGGLGCKGPYTFGDCPVRQKNTADDGTPMNWCVGAQGPGAPSGHVGNGVGEARHVCQGCIEPDFPDWSSLTGDGSKTSNKIKGFYNS